MCFLVNPVPSIQNLSIFPSMSLCRGHKLDGTVPVLFVVPPFEGKDPFSAFFQSLEGLFHRVIRTVFQGFEERLQIGGRRPGALSGPSRDRLWPWGIWLHRSSERRRKLFRLLAGLGHPDLVKGLLSYFLKRIRKVVEKTLAVLWTQQRWCFIWGKTSSPLPRSPGLHYRSPGWGRSYCKCQCMTS